MGLQGQILGCENDLCLVGWLEHLVFSHWVPVISRGVPTPLEAIRNVSNYALE